MDNTDQQLFECKINDLYSYFKNKSIEKFKDIKILDLLNLNKKPEPSGDMFEDMVIGQLYSIIESDETLQELTINKFFDENEKFEIQEDQYQMLIIVRDMGTAIYETYRSDDDKIKQIVENLEESINEKFELEDIEKIIEFLDYFFKFNNH